MSIPGSINPLFLGAAGQATGGGEYQIERSLRFNSSDSAYCYRVFGSPTDAKRQTYSFWVKRTGLGQIGGFPRAITNAYTGGSSATGIYFDSDSIYVTVSNAADTVKSTAVFRDASALYHFVVAVDTTQATASNRVRIYVNGAEITSFSVASYPALNAVTQFANSSTSLIGTLYNAAGYWFDGMLAEFHFIDGQALTPSSFGEFDTNGVWQPIDASGLTYGTNGFHLPFSDNSTAAALGTDTSGNGNDWTPVNFSVSSTNYLKDCTGTPFNSSYSLENMFDGSTSTYMTPISGTWAVFEPSAAIPVTTFEVFGGLSSATASLAPKVNDVDVTNAPLNSVYQWFTPTLSGGVPITSLSKFEFYTARASQAFLVSAIRINGTILISNPEGNDSLVDSPTNYGTDTGVGGEVRGNYCTLNQLDNGGLTLSNGNLQFDRATASWISGRATIGMSSGKWYWEVVQTTGTSMMVGISKGDALQSSYVGAVATGWAYNSADGNKYNNASNSAYGNTYTTNDLIGVAFDVDSGDLKFYKNGTVQNSGTAAYTGLTSGPYFPAVSLYGTATAFTNFGQRPFAYTAPSGFKALCTTNLAEPTIADGSTAMDVTLYTGNGSTQTISGLNFSPDLIWIKERNNSRDHVVQDIIRGSSVFLSTNLTNADQTTGGTGASSVGVQFFNSDGFTIGAGTGVNGSSNTYVAWTWDAGSSTVTNTEGSITSQVRANASAGFSVVTFTKAASTNETIGHGLGVAPTLVIVKTRESSGYTGWAVYHVSTGSNNYLELNATSGSTVSSTICSNTAPTSSVFTMGTAWTATQNMVAYCFAPVAGYSSFGSYSAASAQQGPFVYTGFRPRFIMIKRADSGGFSNFYSWVMIDTARNTYNTLSNDIASLYANRAYQEGLRGQGDAGSPGNMHILSNGFVPGYIGSYSVELNESVTYVYCAWSETPFQYARAR